MINRSLLPPPHPQLIGSGWASPAKSDHEVRTPQCASKPQQTSRNRPPAPCTGRKFHTHLPGLETRSPFSEEHHAIQRGGAPGHDTQPDRLQPRNHRLAAAGAVPTLRDAASPQPEGAFSRSPFSSEPAGRSGEPRAQACGVGLRPGRWSGFLRASAHAGWGPGARCQLVCYAREIIMPARAAMSNNNRHSMDSAPDRARRWAQC